MELDVTTELAVAGRARQRPVDQATDSAIGIA
jgi:hypothetical protein